MSQAIAILGRQPDIGLAELESLYGAASVQPIGDNSAALVHLEAEAIAFERLGGTIKLGKVLARLDATDWQKIEKHLGKAIVNHLQHVPEGKLKLGLSVYGLDVSVSRLNATGLTLKKIVRNASNEQRSVRVVPNKALELNSAQVLHNGLTKPHGYELLLVRDGSTTLLAQTIAVQDIDAYAARDQGRPKRDARVGMLPPKLAQTIINLAAADTSPLYGAVILDPFCGTGVVLQEAVLMGFDVYGSDVEPRMVEYTDKNLMWLQQSYGSPVKRPENQASNPDWRYFKLEVGDATNHQWNPTPSLVACESYLGQPFSSLPSPEKLADVRSTCNLILKKFLQNIHSQLKPGSRLCVAVPAWQERPGQFLHLSALDHLEDLGYNRVSFKHVEPQDLVYARADQIVARELLVLIRS